MPSVLAAGLPNIIGSARIGRTATHSWQVEANGAFFNNKKYDGVTEATSTTSSKAGLGFDASKSSTIYGRSDTVQPPAICLIPQLRY